MVTILIRHYLFCSIGAALRFLIEKLKSVQPEKRTPTFKEIYNYKKYPENELLDGIIGFLILGLTLTLILI